MDRKKTITPITDKDLSDIIENSVQGAANRLVGNAAEQKKMFVRPIANSDGTPNVFGLVKRVAEEAEAALNEVAEHFTEAVTGEEEIREIATNIAEEKTRGLQPSIDEALETASKTIVGAINELRTVIAKATVLELTKVVPELPEQGEPNKFYLVSKTDTDENDLYDEYLWVNKGTKEEPNYGWEFQGAKKIDVHIEDVIKKANIGAGLRVASDGKVNINGATRAQIDAGASNSAPLTTNNIRYAVKKGVTDNDETLTEGDQELARDWLGAVGKEDWATDNVGGVLRGVKAFGFGVDQYGRGFIAKAEKSDIDTATNEYKPIVPKLRDYFLMKGLSDCKEPELWTDDTKDENGAVVKGTKTKACETIGAVPKLENPNATTNNLPQAYILTPNQEVRLLDITEWGTSANTIPKRDNGGRIKAAPPVANNDVTNKQYVANLPDDLTLSADQQEEWRTMIGVGLGGEVTPTSLYLHTVTSETSPAYKLFLVTTFAERILSDTHLYTIVRDSGHTILSVSDNTRYPFISITVDPVNSMFGVRKVYLNDELQVVVGGVITGPTTDTVTKL